MLLRRRETYFDDEVGEVVGEPDSGALDAEVVPPGAVIVTKPPIVVFTQLQ